MEAAFVYELEQFIATLATEPGPLGAFGAAFVTFHQAEVSAAMVAELTFARRLVTAGTGCLPGIYRTGEHIGLGGLALDIFLALAGPGRHHFDILPGGILYTKPFLLIPIVLAHPLAAFGAANKMTLGFVLGNLEGLLMLFMPLRTHAAAPLGKDIGAPLHPVPHPVVAGGMRR